MLITTGLIASRDRTMEYAAVEDVYCPHLHRINQVVRHRAIYGGNTIPPIPPILLKYSHPPEDLVEKCRPVLEDLIETAAVKEGTYLPKKLFWTTCVLAC